jgi:antitoxin CptB
LIGGDTPGAPSREAAGEDPVERAQLRWRCRRGMRELDVLLIHFFEASFDGLCTADKRAFRAILDLPDPELQAYLIAGHASEDPEREALLGRIRSSLHP